MHQRAQVKNSLIFTPVILRCFCDDQLIKLLIPVSEKITQPYNVSVEMFLLLDIWTLVNVRNCTKHLF
jgi:hypothetical protein